MRPLLLMVPCFLLASVLASPLAHAEQTETLTIMRGTPHQTTCTIKRGDSE